MITEEIPDEMAPPTKNASSRKMKSTVYRPDSQSMLGALMRVPLKIASGKTLMSSMGDMYEGKARSSMPQTERIQSTVPMSVKENILHSLNP